MTRCTCQVYTFVIADCPIGIVIILVHPTNSLDMRNVQHYTQKLGWQLKHLIWIEDWLSCAMHVQVLSEGVLRDSSMYSDSLPGEP